MTEENKKVIEASEVVENKEKETAVIESNIEKSDEITDELEYKPAEETTPTVLTTDDIKNALSSDDTKDVFGDNINHMSDESILKFVDVVQRVNNGEKFHTFNVLPDELKSYINKQLADNGMVGYSSEINEIRNNLSDMLVQQFTSTLSMQKEISNFNEQISNIYNEYEGDISKMYKDYEIDKDKQLNDLLKNIPEGDERREKVKQVQEALYEAHTFKIFAEEAKHVKVKPIMLKKPNKYFDEFTFKFKDDKNFNFKMDQILAILNKYNAPTEDDPDMNLKFLLGFCVYCRNLKVKNLYDHAFMYYTLYNIALLNIYRGDEYNEYAPEFLNNINKIINILERK